MKILLSCFLIVWLIFRLAAQEEFHTEIKTDLSVAEAERFISKEASPPALLEFVAAVLKEDKRDLIEVCFKNPHTRGNLHEAVSLMEDSPQKEALLLLMLRTESGWWPTDNPSPFVMPLPSRLDESLVSLLQKYLPDLTLDDSLIATNAARGKLAVDLEQAMNRTASPALNTSVSQRVNKPNVVDDPAGSTVVARQNAGQDKTPITPTQYLLWTLAVLAGLGAITFLVKRKTDG